jgi:hypothetical protein
MCNVNENVSASDYEIRSATENEDEIVAVATMNVSANMKEKSRRNGKNENE